MKEAPIGIHTVRRGFWLERMEISMWNWLGEGSFAVPKNDACSSATGIENGGCVVTSSNIY